LKHDDYCASEKEKEKEKEERERRKREDAKPMQK
jgi:hypothetical protein